MNPPPKTKQLTMRVTLEQRQQLKEAAARHEVTITDLVKTALADRYGVQLTA